MNDNYFNINNIYVITILLFCFSCKNKNKAAIQENSAVTNQKIVQPEFQTILEAADVKGSILIYNLKEDRYYSNDFEWANTGQLPASTFKIANSIIGLEVGVIDSDSTVFKWDGKKKDLKNWEQDLILKDAFQFSCVPCYQEVARNIGPVKMNQYVQKLNYGDLKVDASNIDNFWLRGASRISQIQQIDFLKRLYTNKLPISKRTNQIVKRIMKMNSTDSYQLSGKSGLSNQNGNYNGWYVGFLELNNNTYMFATNIEPKNEFDFDTFIKKRLEVTLKAFKSLKIIP